MVKKFVVISVFFLALLMPATLFADQGVGIVLGEPTGLSYKSGNLAIGLGWSFTSADNRIDATIDWWLINDHLVEMFDWYLGAGAKLGLKLNQDNDTFNVGLRIPIGVQWWPTKELEVFAELSPGILLIPETKFDMGAGIGIRYYF